MTRVSIAWFGQTRCVVVESEEIGCSSNSFFLSTSERRKKSLKELFDKILESRNIIKSGEARQIFNVDVDELVQSKISIFIFDSLRVVPFKLR